VVAVVVVVAVGVVVAVAVGVVVAVVVRRCSMNGDKLPRILPGELDALMRLHAAVYGFVVDRDSVIDDKDRKRLINRAADAIERINRGGRGDET
jgi:hypothetical protein